MKKKRKQLIKFKSNGQQGLKTCKNCKTFLNPYTTANYCSKRCSKQDSSVKDVILNGR